MARRLAAILAADVAGYSRLMHADENATHARLRAAMAEVIAPTIGRHDGRIVKTTGDGFLAEFASAVAAVGCAVEFQQALGVAAALDAEDHRLLFRVGINVGDVIVDGNDIHGDHVNLAARLEQLAIPGGILVSGSVHEYASGRVECRFEDAGEQQVRNIARPVRTYRVFPGREPAAAAAQPAMPSRPPLRLSLFGPVSLRSDAQEIRIKSLKLRAMLGYIALSETLVETRERLVGLLWSESGEEQARAVLRQVVRELRTLTAEAGHDAIRVGTREIGFQPDIVDVDVWSVIRSAEAGEVHSLLLERPHLPEELLAGLEDLDPAFRVWVVAKRHTVRDRLLRALEASLAGDVPDRRKQVRLAEAILNLDPTHEEACRSLMRARAAAGDTAGALRAYKALWDLLDEDYGMEPSAATQELVAQIKMGALEPAHTDGADSAVAGARHETRLRLSIQPIAVQAVDPDKAHLVLGFRQHLIASLVRFREWKVTDAPLAVADATQDISGCYELQLTVHQSGQAIHLMLMLKELETSLYIWSDSFELKMENWFEAQRRVVQRVAMALNVHLSAERLQRFSEVPDVSLGIYDRWLRCQALVRTFGSEHLDRARRQFTDIIQAAPNFVPAYVGLTNLQNIEPISRPGVFRTREREQVALEFAQRAVQLDPAESGAQRCLAWAHAMAKQYTQAEMHIELACELNPNDSWTLISAALLLVFCGQPERGVALAGPAMNIAFAPSRTHWHYQFDIEFLTGDYEAALAIADRAQEVLQGTRSGWRAAALAHLGRGEEARAEAGRFLATIRANWFGDEPATDEAIVRWLLHLYPIRRREDWERLRDGLHTAGLPIGTIEHHGW